MKQKDLRGKLKLLNKTEFKGITQKIKQVREDLKEVQSKIRSQYSDMQAAEERNIIGQLKK